MKKSYFFSFLFVLLIVTGVFFFGKKKGTRDMNILRIALPSDVSTLHFSSSSKGSLLNASYVITMLFEGLMRKDEKGLPQFAIAHKVDISRDKKKYTFHLKDCEWSDGVKVTAHDFEYSWKKAIDPSSKTITPSPYYYYPIKNAKRCLLGEALIEDVGIQVVDDKTLLVELEYPAPYFLEIVAHPFFFPVPKHVAENNPQWAIGPGLICNGPFKLQEWKKNSRLFLVKNLCYVDQENVYLSGIDISIVPSSQTALYLFQKGELDWTGSPFFSMSYDISHDLLNENHEDIMISWIAINTDKYPFNNKKLRQALSYSVNRSAITENVFDHSAVPRMSALPHAIRLTNRGYFRDNDTELAKKCFQEALDELGLTIEQLPEIELSFIANVEYESRIVQAVQDQWRTVLGIQKVRLKPYEENVYLNHVTSGNYDLGFMCRISLISDPLFILNCFRSKSDLMNKTNWENEEFRQLLEQSDFALGDIERTNILIQAETLLMDEMPVIPICSLNKRFAKNPKLKGEFVPPVPAIDFKSAFFEQCEK